MKTTRILLGLLALTALLPFAGCSGSSGSGDSGGTTPVSIALTDARPMLPAGATAATNLEITFTQVAVHASGGDWLSLPLGGTSPQTIDLLRFHDGATTQLVPPVPVDNGRYTQILIAVATARISFDHGATWSPVEIPSGNLKTDKNFAFEAAGGPAAVALVVDFDLSQSLVVSPGQGTTTYKLKPVLHIVETSLAAAISGWIYRSSFVADQAAMVTVLVPSSDMPSGYAEYTRLAVDKAAGDAPTAFKIYWLVPNQYYRVEIDFNPEAADGPEYVEEVGADDLPPGADFALNGGSPM